MNKLNVALICYAFAGKNNSEGLIAANISKYLSKKCNLTIFTRSNNINDLVLRKNRNTSFIGVDNKFFLIFKNKRFGSRVYSLIWHFFVAIKLREMNYKFDIVHHFNHHTLSTPHFLWLIDKSIPIIWGPLNSNERMPIFLERGIHNKVKNLLAYLFKIFIQKFSFLNIYAMKRTDLILISRNNLKLPPNSFNSIQHFSQLGCDVKKKRDSIQLIETIKNKALEKETRLIVIGRLSGYISSLKNIDIALNSCINISNESTERNLKFIFILTGPNDQSIALRLLKNAKFLSDFEIHMQKTYYEVQKLLKNSHYLLNLSYESAGLINVEAASYGTPLICVQNTEADKLFLKIKDIKRIKENSLRNISLVQKEILEIINKTRNKDDYIRISKMFLTKSSEYMWKEKSKKLLEIYYSILSCKSK